MKSKRVHLVFLLFALGVAVLRANETKTPLRYLEFTIDVESSGSRERGRREITRAMWDYRWRVEGVVSVDAKAEDDGAISYTPQRQPEILRVSGDATAFERTDRRGLEGEGGITDFSAYVEERWVMNTALKGVGFFALIVNSDKTAEWRYDSPLGQIGDWSGQLRDVADYTGVSRLGPDEEENVSRDGFVPRLDSFAGPGHNGGYVSGASELFRDAGGRRAVSVSPAVVQDKITSTVTLPNGGSASATFTWRLVRELPPVELLVSAAGYADWRPTAKADNTAGAPLKFLAEVIGPDGKSPPKDVAVKRWKWRLDGTSKEPGIALNFPYASEDEQADLRLASSRHTISFEQQEATYDPTSASGSLTDELSVEPYDWGGWATLLVEAELADGRKLTGRLRGRPEGEPILVPDRAKGSLVARVWAREKGVLGKPDADDVEKSSLGLKNADGDGFSIYEEYRGFYVNGKHRSLDPGDKDFFICNLIGDKAKPGIALFTRLSQLRVHHQLRDGREFSQKFRRMNVNRTAGPQRVAQHGVVLLTDPSADGGMTYFSSTASRSRPATVLRIAIQDPTKPNTTLTKTFNTATADQPFVYDRTIAHELFHGIGVDHHGEGDGNAMFRFVFSDDPVYGDGRDKFVWYNTDTEARLLGERDNRNLLREKGDALRKIRDILWRSQYSEPMPPRTAGRAPIPLNPAGTLVSHATRIREMSEAESNLHRLNEMLGIQSYYVGDKGGQASGDDQCVMRYHFADLFQSTQPATYYMIETDPEPAGRQICPSSNGTGVNRSGRKPEPRFGNAAAGRGGCAHVFCVNDDVK
jgi:hypothetical protein